MDRWHDLLNLFWAFLKANLLGYGGGPSIIPLIEAEVVDRYHWLTQEGFATALAAGNSLPGPIATKLAVYVGFQVGGWAGSIAAVTATAVPTGLLMIFLLGALSRLRENPIVLGMIQGVQPVVWVLFLLLVIDYRAFILSAPRLGVAAVAFVLMYWLRVHPAVVVLGALAFGAIAMRSTH